MLQRSFSTRCFAGKDFRGNLLSAVILDLPRITFYFRVGLSDTFGNWVTAEHRVLVALMGLNAYIWFSHYCKSYSWDEQLRVINDVV
jgi:hypothetical protein